MSLGVRQIVFLLVPSSIVVAVLAEPLTRLIYQRGAFTPDQTPVVAASLAAFALGLTFNGTMLMLNRAFFSLQSNWIPTLVALGNLFVNLVLDLAFAPLGIWGIPLATSLVNIAGTATLLVLLRRRVGRIHFGEIAVVVVADRGRRARRGRRRVRRLVRARRRARPRRARPDRVAGRRPGRGRGGRTSGCASCSASASWTRSVR